MPYIGATPTTQSFISGTDYFNGTGSATAFTLTRAVTSVNDIQAVVNNVVQVPNDAYTISGTTITFTSAPSSGTSNVYVRYLSTTTQSISPSQGTVGTSQLGTITNIASGNTALTLQTGSTPTTAVTVDTSQNVGIGTSSPTTKLQVAGTTKIGVTGTNGVLQLARTSDGATISSFKTDGTSGIIDSPVSTIFQINTAEAMRIDSSSNVLIGTTTSTAKFTAKRATAGDVCGFQNGSDAGYGMTFYNVAGTFAGYISWTATTTTYVTSSDYRLKENIAPMTGALAKVQQLKPVTYTWKINGTPSQGFIAHELQAVVPECVAGEKDAVETYIDEDGDEQTRIKPQGIDTSFLVATLTAAIQELNAKVDAQAATISTLQARLPAENT